MTRKDADTQPLRESGEGNPSLYLALLKRTLMNTIYGHLDVRSVIGRNRLTRCIASFARSRGLDIVRASPVTEAEMSEGLGRPRNALTMIGQKRLDNLQHCVENILADEVPGDLIETGVWRGGATIFMRGILKAYGISDRSVWVADSFEGLPKPNANRYVADAGDKHWTQRDLAISLEEVKANFDRFGLLDKQVHFLKGWFRDTLPAAPIDCLSLARLDGDMYESTMDALTHLYPKLSVGGYLIVDDYSIVGCRRAVGDYRSANGIRDEMKQIDWTGWFWRRTT